MAARRNLQCMVQDKAQATREHNGVKIVDQVVPGYTIELPKWNAKCNIKMMGFVDEKRHYTNTFTQQLITTVVKAMKKYVST